MKPLTGKQVVAVLTRHGFVRTRQRGSHVIFRNPRTGATVPVPLHGRSRPIPIGTLNAIIPPQFSTHDVRVKNYGTSWDFSHQEVRTGQTP